MSIVDPTASKKTASKKEKPTGGVKLKKSIAKKTKPKDTESNGEPQPNHYTFDSILTSKNIIYQASRQVVLLAVLLQTLPP